MRIEKFIITVLCYMLLCTTALGQNEFSKRESPPIPPETKLKLEKQLSGAEAHYESNPDNPDAMIWLGRRQAYLGRFTEAIGTFTKGIAKFPGDARFYRHRGHRHITLRQPSRCRTVQSAVSIRVSTAPSLKCSVRPSAVTPHR